MRNKRDAIPRPRVFCRTRLTMTTTISEDNPSPTICSRSGEERSTKPISILFDEQDSIRSDAEKDPGVPVLEGWPLGSTVFAYVGCILSRIQMLMNYQIMPSSSSGNARHHHHIHFTDHDRFRIGSFRPSKLDPGIVSIDVLWISSDLHPTE